MHRNDLCGHQQSEHHHYDQINDQIINDQSNVWLSPSSCNHDDDVPTKMGLFLPSTCLIFSSFFTFILSARSANSWIGWHQLSHHGGWQSANDSSYFVSSYSSFLSETFLLELSRRPEPALGSSGFHPFGIMITSVSQAVSQWVALRGLAFN